MFRKLLSIVLLLFVSAALQAQQANNAILVGVISDSTGAFLPGATVTATHVATNTSVDILTDERGQYRTPPLRIGDYELTVRLDGFRTFVRRGVVLNIGDVRNVDVTLEIGAIAETVTVDATPPPLNTSDSTVGTVITNEQIAALPLNGRDYLQLASLSSGTGPASSQGVVIGGQSGTASPSCSTGTTTTASRSRPVIRGRRRSSSRQSTRFRSSRSSPTATQRNTAAPRQAWSACRSSRERTA